MTGELEPGNDGFQNLFEALDVTTRGEKTRAEISIYSRVADRMDYEEIESPDDITKMVDAGNAVAQIYAELAYGLRDNSELEDDFYSLDMEERLYRLENNSETPRFLN